MQGLCRARKAGIPGRKAARGLLLFLFAVLSAALAVSLLTGRPVAMARAAEPGLEQGVPFPPPPKHWVYDGAGLLSAAEEAELARRIDELKARTTAEVGVAVLPSVAPLTPKEYATALFERWGVGEKGKDNGVLILVAVAERRVEIETGYGVEGVLPDGKVGRILDQAVVPRLRAGRYGEALLAAVEAISAALSEEAGGPGGQGEQKGPSPAWSAFSWPAALLLLVFALPFVLSGWVWAALRGVRPQPCPRCGRPLKVQRRVLEEAAVGRPGRAVVVRSCRSCGFEEEEEVSLPPLSEESPGRRFWRRGGWGGLGGGGFFGGWGGGSGGGFGGGFGGGSSGGGGAGRNW
ncbi:MAG: TPM domain-containing protein [Bacillota bacterium]|nr:TPM domain-containing protein [Bacillota bacterium]